MLDFSCLISVTYTKGWRDYQKVFEKRPKVFHLSSRNRKQETRAPHASHKTINLMTLPSLFIVLATAAVLLISRAADVDALQCFCNNGKVVVSEPQCACECLSGFQLPDCDYTISETVRLDVYIAMPASEFQSDPFLRAIEVGTKLDINQSKFLYAVALDNFNKTNVLITMPGYGVKRFLPAIEAQEVWVQGQNIEAGYVIPIPAGRNNIASLFPTFDYRGATITAEGWSWLASAMFLVTFGICLECCCMKNTEDRGYDFEDEENRNKNFSVYPGKSTSKVDKTRSNKPKPKGKETPQPLHDPMEEEVHTRPIVVKPVQDKKESL